MDKIIFSLTYNTESQASKAAGKLGRFAGLKDSAHIQRDGSSVIVTASDIDILKRGFYNAVRNVGGNAKIQTLGSIGVVQQVREERVVDSMHKNALEVEVLNEALRPIYGPISKMNDGNLTKSVLEQTWTKGREQFLMEAYDSSEKMLIKAQGGVDAILDKYGSRGVSENLQILERKVEEAKVVLSFNERLRRYFDDNENPLVSEAEIEGEFGLPFFAIQGSVARTRRIELPKAMEVVATYEQSKTQRSILKTILPRLDALLDIYSDGLAVDNWRKSSHVSSNILFRIEKKTPYSFSCILPVFQTLEKSPFLDLLDRVFLAPYRPHLMSIQKGSTLNEGNALVSFYLSSRDEPNKPEADYLIFDYLKYMRNSLEFEKLEALGLKLSLELRT